MLFNPRIVTGSKPSKTFKAAENQSYWPKIKKKKKKNLGIYLHFYREIRTVVMEKVLSEESVL